MKRICLVAIIYFIAVLVVILLATFSPGVQAAPTKEETYTTAEVRAIIDAAVKKGFAIGLKTQIKGCATSL